MNIEKIRNLYLGERYTVREVADKLGLSFWTIYELMRKNNIPRRNYSEASYATYDKYKPRFLIKRDTDLKDQELKIAGIMLYWAEGTLKGSTVDFANSNSHMIKIFLKFLRQMCGVDEKRLRVYLYGYTYNKLPQLKRYWRNITSIPLSQFTKPYIRKGNPNLSKRKLPYGLVHIRYNDKRLLALIKSWIDEYIKWGDSEAAKRNRLFKKQRLVERRDGKVGEFREIPTISGQS